MPIPYTFLEKVPHGPSMAFALSNTFTLSDDPAHSTFTMGQLFGMTFGLGGSPYHTDHWEIDAGWGNDVINAADSTEDNIFRGGFGNDNITGGSGDDYIDGGFGNDIMTGNGGIDTFALSRGQDVIQDFEATLKNYETIDFEGITTSSFADWVPDGYMGLDWNNAAALHHDYAPGSGYQNVLNSGDYVGLDNAALGLSFSNSTEDFDLVSANMAAAWNNDLEVTVKAYDDDVLVGTANLLLDPTKELIDFSLYADANNRFTSIDTVEIVGEGGTNAGLGGGGEIVAMDDIVLAYGEPGDLIDVPDGCDITALLDSAVSDGHGGTVLTCGTDTLTLTGVAPGELTADMFV